MRKTGRLLALLLCLALLTSLFPAALAAEIPEGEPDAPERVEALLEDPQAGEPIPEEPPEAPLDGNEPAEETPEEEPASPSADERPEEPDSPADPAPVRVAFVCTPAETLVRVYDPVRPDESGEPGALAPEEDGSWLLLPGRYLYEASCEGWEPLERTELTVTEPIEIEVTLCPAEGDEPETEEPAERPEDEPEESEEPADGERIMFVPEEEDEGAPRMARSIGAWSLPTIDGGTVTSQSYADRLQLLVFYNGTGGCYNSIRTIQELAEAYWIGNEAIQVIAVECMGCSAEQTAAFCAACAPDCDEIIFAYGGANLMWDYVIESGGYESDKGYSISFCFCVILKDGARVDDWDRNDSARKAAGHLSAFADLGQDESIGTTVVDGSYCQSEARGMLEMINAFRTGDQAWFWNSDDTTKTVYAPGELGALSYDYGLEKVAMQRAAELAVYYSHTRPDGRGCFDLEIDGISSWGENIAYGYYAFLTADSVFTAWREDDEPYSGQGHRRNMLTPGFTAVGFGCYRIGSYYYWVQEFGYANSGAAATPANNSPTQVRVDYMKEWFPDVTPAEPVNPAPLPGDLNLDGLVNGADLVRIARQVKGGTTLTGGDLNQDGRQDAADVKLLSRAIKGKSSPA